MRRAGFSFHHFAGGGFGSRLFKPFLRRNGEIDPANQYIWAEAVYVKDFMQLHRLSTGKLLKLAVILHEVQESYDLCALILEEYDRKAGARLRERYMRVLLGQEPVPQATA